MNPIVYIFIRMEAVAHRSEQIVIATSREDGGWGVVERAELNMSFSAFCSDRKSKKEKI